MLVSYRKVEELVNLRVKALRVKEKDKIMSGMDRCLLRIKMERKVKSIKYKSVTVLFADIQDSQDWST